MVEEPPREDQKNQPEQRLNIRVEGAGAVYPSAKAPSSDTAQKSNDSESDTQNEALWWKRISHLIAAVLTSSNFWIATATIAIAFFTAELYRVSKQQGDTMQRQLEISERPQVAVGQDIQIIGSPESAAHINAILHLRNTGNSIALDVEPALWATDIFGAAKLNEKCAAMTGPEETARALHIKRNGYVIFPQDSITVQIAPQSGAPEHAQQVLYLQVCVAYSDEIGIVHLTRTCFAQDLVGARKGFGLTSCGGSAS